jgi:carbamoylphosphate synthase small subunit
MANNRYLFAFSAVFSGKRLAKSEITMHFNAHKVFCSVFFGLQTSATPPSYDQQIISFTDV